MSTNSRRIINYLHVVSRPLKPSEIAQNLKLNPNSVRGCLSRLVKKGEVFKEFAHHYVISPTYGLGNQAGYLKPPRVQNLLIVGQCKKGTVKEHEIIKIPLDDLSIRIEFGSKRDKINYRVKAPKGLDLYGLRLVHRIALIEADRRSLVDVSWGAVNFELLWDDESIRLEGVKAVTFDDLEGTMEKFYNKDPGLRREIRGSSPMNVRDLESLIQGGITATTALQSVGILHKDVKDLTESVKGIFYQYRDMKTAFEADHIAIMRIIDLMEKKWNDEK